MRAVEGGVNLYAVEGLGTADEVGAFGGEVVGVGFGECPTGGADTNVSCVCGHCNSIEKRTYPGTMILSQGSGTRWVHLQRLIFDGDVETGWRDEVRLGCCVGCVRSSGSDRAESRGCASFV